MNDMVILAKEKNASSLLLEEIENETGTPTGYQGHGNLLDGSSIHLARKNFISAFDMKDEVDLNSHTYYRTNIKLSNPARTQNHSRRPISLTKNREKERRRKREKARERERERETEKHTKSHKKTTYCYRM